MEPITFERRLSERSIAYQIDSSMWAAYPSIQAGINPGRYAAESGQAANRSPVMPGNLGATAGTGQLLFVVGAVVLLWVLERGRLGLGFKFGAKG